MGQRKILKITTILRDSENKEAFRNVYVHTYINTHIKAYMHVVNPPMINTCNGRIETHRCGC
jgi:hypothetical protein